MNNIIIVILLLIGTLNAQSTHSQLNFTTNKFNQIESNLTNLDVNVVTDLGISFPLDDRIKKYDKVIVRLYFKKMSEENSSFTKSTTAVLTLYPTSKTFEDNYGNVKEMKIHLISPKDGSHIALTSKDYYKSANAIAYKAVVHGYFENGIETTWSEYKKAYETKKVYAYSKEVYESSEFSFAPNQEAINRVNNQERFIEKSLEYDRIHKELQEYITPAYRLLAARCYNSCGTGIKEQRKTSRQDQNEESLDDLIALELKFLEIFKNKGAKDLHLQINKLSDYPEIKKVVFAF